MAERWPAARALKFRQAAFVYLHLGVLYEAAAWVMWRGGALPQRFGPPWVFLVLGVGLVAFAFWGLYRWQNVWVARTFWTLQAFRFPALINRAFVDTETSHFSPAFYVAAMIVIVISMWALARAAWDL